MSGSAKKIFRKGDVLVREGEQGDCAYIIETGNVEILVHREGQLVQIGTRGPGSLIGEMAMIDDKPRTATVRALDECHVMEMSREDFARRVEAADPVLKMVMRVIMARYRDVISRTQFIKFPPDQAGSAETSESSDSIRDVALSTIKIHNELKIALEKKQLLLYYQPIIDLQNVKIAGFEALMRWKHPEKGMIPPGVFIPVAEESGLIVELSKWALEESCATVKALREKANPKLMAQNPLFISVNFSVKDFSDRDFFNQVATTLSKSGTDPKHIHLEITESLLMEAPEAAKDALEKCRRHGISVSIDDFGSGYSSLSYLHYFPIDTLKIDQSFIRAMITHEASRVLVKSIIALARNLNMHVIAEGIETPEEARIVRNMGCEQCQGFWFAKPLPFQDAVEFVQGWQPPTISS